MSSRKRVHRHPISSPRAGAAYDPAHVAIGQRIAGFRKAAGLVQSQIGDRFGVTGACFSNWEAGRGLPDAVVLVGLARLFGVAVDRLLGVDDGGDFGEPRADGESWPFRVLTPAHVRRLHPENLKTVEHLALDLLGRQERA